MRIIAWNANYNNRKSRTLEDNLDLLAPLHPDLVVLSETGLPRDPSIGAYLAGDQAPVLAIVPCTGFHVEQVPGNDRAPMYSTFLRVSGPCHFTLGAIWPVKQEGGPGYASLLNRLLDHFHEALSEHPVILAGDFNSSTRVSGQEASHPKLVDRLQQRGLRSVYHEHSGEAHGSESIATYYWRTKDPQPFHIDYCWVSESLLPGATVTIPQSQEWRALSDHAPLIIDVPLGAFTPNAGFAASRSRG